MWVDGPEHFECPDSVKSLESLERWDPQFLLRVITSPLPLQEIELEDIIHATLHIAK